VYEQEDMYDKIQKLFLVQAELLFGSGRVRIVISIGTSIDVLYLAFRISLRLWRGYKNS
jgi:hypothetical protein